MKRSLALYKKLIIVGVVFIATSARASTNSGSVNSLRRQMQPSAEADSIVREIKSDLEAYKLRRARLREVEYYPDSLLGPNRVPGNSIIRAVVDSLGDVREVSVSTFYSAGGNSSTAYLIGLLPAMIAIETVHIGADGGVASRLITRWYYRDGALISAVTEGGEAQDIKDHAVADQADSEYGHMATIADSVRAQLARSEHAPGDAPVALADSISAEIAGASMSAPNVGESTPESVTSARVVVMGMVLSVAMLIGTAIGLMRRKSRLGTRRRRPAPASTIGKSASPARAGIARSNASRRSDSSCVRTPGTLNEREHPIASRDEPKRLLRTNPALSTASQSGSLHGTLQLVMAIIVLYFGAKVVFGLITSSGNGDAAYEVAEASCVQIAGRYSGLAQIGYVQGGATLNVRSGCDFEFDQVVPGYGSTTQLGRVVESQGQYELVCNDGSCTYDIRFPSNRAVISETTWSAEMSR